MSVSVPVSAMLVSMSVLLVDDAYIQLVMKQGACLVEGRWLCCCRSDGKLIAVWGYSVIVGD